MFSPTAKFPGLLIFSERAVPVAAWLSGLELAMVRYSPAPRSQILLETGASDSWIVANLDISTQMAIATEAVGFERLKEQANGVHFLAVQSSPTAEEFAGFWLLKEAGVASGYF